MTDEFAFLLQTTAKERRQIATGLDRQDANDAARYWDDHFRLFAHEGQSPPAGAWRVWMVMGGRGFGKTRAGAEYIRSIAEGDPSARIALVGASLGEVRRVMVEGESGLIACCAPQERPDFEPSLQRLRWPNGAQAHLYSAAEPESLRGPQHSHACCASAKGGDREREPAPDRYPAAPQGRGAVVDPSRSS